MKIEREHQWAGLVLGALAVRSPHDEWVSLSLVQANLMRVVAPAVATDSMVPALIVLEKAGYVYREGDYAVHETCRLCLAPRSRPEISFELVGTGFVVGALALHYHYAPLVQVSELRRAAYRLWPPRAVDEPLYSIVQRLRAERHIMSRDLTSDVDQWYVSLRTDMQLLPV